MCVWGGHSFRWGGGESMEGRFEPKPERGEGSSHRRSPGRTVPGEGSRNFKGKGPEAGVEVCMFMKRTKSQCSISRVAIREQRWHHAGPLACVTEFGFSERSHRVDERK